MNPLESALNCNKSIFIQACAGAGKTFALTKRYANILDSFSQECLSAGKTELLGPKNILVITFTKKAAGEMKERILKDVNTLLSGKELKEMKEQGFDFCPNLRKPGNEIQENFKIDLRDNFSQNAISTIDAFCAGVLREFSYKLGIDPQFLSQDDHDAKKLLNENLDNWITETLKDNPTSFDLLNDELAFYQIKEILKSMYTSREILDDYLQDFENKSEVEIWQEWLRRYTPDVDIEKLLASFEHMWQNAQSLCLDENDALFIGLKEMAFNVSTLDRHEPYEVLSEFVSNIVRKGVLMTKAGTYSKRLAGKATNWSDKKELVKDWLNYLQATISEEDVSMTPGLGDRKIIPILKELIEKFREFDEYFRAIRMDRDLLDFSDVLILTHKLLSEHEDVRRTLGKRYKHILLDEFQDTNPLRWQIIEMIIDANPDIKLFVVGDRKQSIYRFNNADVTVMNTAQEKVENMDGDSVDFNDNYRSSMQLIDAAVNPLMSMIFRAVGDKKEPYEADFAPTLSPIDKPGIAPALETIWCAMNGDEEDYIPAYHCAYQVEKLLEEYENSKIDPGEDKPLIAVLLRRYTRLSDYIQAFGKRGIPISILGGKHFYKSSALMDVFHLISVLDNPRDDHALIALLRSPFFSISDPMIHKLKDRKFAAFDVMSEFPELLQSYREILTWIDESKTQAIDLLIASILDDKDRELGYVSELLPEQELANLDKAINIIRGLQRSGSTLRDIREFLHYQISTNADEAQAVYAAKARVQLLTVHKAKGLEFPIVLIPEMNQSGKSDSNKFRYGRYNKKHEISLSLGDDEKPGLLMRLKDITKKEEEAEDKRVFYVALTRAIYKAVLLGEGKKAIANTWWTKYILGIEDLDKVDKKSMEADSWDENILHVKHEQVLNISGVDTFEAMDWKEKEQFDEPGKYLYRSPHDLMGQKEDVDFSNVEGGLGTAPGKIFHYCMEQGWLDYKKYATDIHEHINTFYSTLPTADLITKIKPWLENMSRHELASVLLDAKTEKYPELKIKAWLGNRKDIVQINGVIDLLYKKDDEWVILDYKTDASKRLLAGYRKQLQSYQWMVKQAYGIQAKARIYFAALNEVVDVEWDDDYFETLPLGLNLTAQLPRAKSILANIKNEILEGPHCILCASGQHEEQVYMALVNEGLMRPDIKVSTLSKFIQEGAKNGLSQDHLRLRIRHANPGMKDGTADHLAKALRNEELGKGQVKQEFKELYQDILSDPNYRPANVAYQQVEDEGQRFILLDIYTQTELEKKFISTLKSKTSVVELSLIDKKDSDEGTLIEAFSPREEVLACAKHIMEHCAKDEQVMIAVASMEKYAPHLQRQLPHLGLRARFIGDRSLLEFPCISLLMSLLNVFRKPVPEWKDIAPVVLHPLMKPGSELLQYDEKCRKEPLLERTLPLSVQEFCKTTNTKDLKELSQKFSNFIKNIKKTQDPDTDKACDKFMEVLDSVIVDLLCIKPKSGIHDLVNEMNIRLKKTGLPRRNQWNGIPVLGLLDSLGTQVDKLYILGMIEGDIPRNGNENPFFIKNRDYTLELNRHFMNVWKKLGDQVVYCCSTHAEDGSDQSRSSFFEGMNLRLCEQREISRRQQLLHYVDKHIKGKEDEVIKRHQEILEKVRGHYSGDVNEMKNNIDMSVSQVDTLLKCPMRYYYDFVLKCKPMDQNENLFWGSKKGNVIHCSYEAFIKAGGYGLEEEAALKLMDDCLNKALETENIDTDDVQQMDRFRHYVKNLYAGSDKNCLVKNLQAIRETYSSYTQFECEKAFRELKFEHPNLDISLRGRIDKIMLDNEEKKLIASDFKTGTVNTALLSKMMLSQLYIYLVYCEKHYPAYELKAMYEKLKDPKDCKTVEYMKVGEEYKQLGKNAKQSFLIEEFEKHLSDLFSQIAAGKYYITEQAYKDACENCPYVGLCRRDTRLKN